MSSRRFARRAGLFLSVFGSLWAASACFMKDLTRRPERNTNDFWRFLEQAHERQLKERPLEAGIVDTSRYVWPLSMQPDASGPLPTEVSPFLDQ